MNSLPKRVIAYLSEYLCYVDKMSLKLTCNQCSLISLNFKKVIKKKLTKYIDDPKTFCQKLHQTGAILSGSFIISCLYDNDNFNDFDVFEKESTNNKSYYTNFNNYLWQKI